MKIRFYGRYNKDTKDEYLAFKIEEDCNIHQTSSHPSAISFLPKGVDNLFFLEW